MERKKFSYQLSDGKDYYFSERNKEDADIGGLLDKLRAYWFKFIQTNVEDKDERLTLLMHILNKSYTQYDIAEFLNSDISAMKKLVYDSFKVLNQIPYEEFDKLLLNDNVRAVSNLIAEIEKQATDEKKKTVKK